MIRKKMVVGDVFEVRIDDVTKKFLQYVADDATQLSSPVVRVFRKSYGVGESPDLLSVTQGEVDFHAHVLSLRLGVKQQAWRKVGHAPPPLDLDDVLFRDSMDYGKPHIKVSRDWHVWKIGGPFESVGALGPRYERAEVGIIIPPARVVHRMRNGQYDFVYPGY